MNLEQSQPPNPVRYLKFPTIEKCGEIGGKYPYPVMYDKEGIDASKPS